VCTNVSVCVYVCVRVKLYQEICCTDELELYICGGDAHRNSKCCCQSCLSRAPASPQYTYMSA